MRHVPKARLADISSRIFTRATCPGHVWRMVPELPLLRSSSVMTCLVAHAQAFPISARFIHLTEYVFHNAVHRSRPASSLMPKLFRYMRTSYALIGHDLPNGKFATVVIIICLQAIQHVHRHDDAKTEPFSRVSAQSLQLRLLLASSRCPNSCTPLVFAGAIQVTKDLWYTP